MPIVIALIICILVIAFSAYAIKNQRQEADQRLAMQQANHEQRLADIRQHAEREAAANSQQRQAEMQLMREEMRRQFEQEMLQRTTQLKAEAQERMEQLRQTNSQQMEQIVGPLRSELERLRQLVDQSKTEQTKQTTALEASIRAVFEHDKARDKTTENLANALRNRGKVQGDWGEQVLENILRDSGLREGEEFVRQPNIKTKGGANERPDILVYGADGSSIIIDSKVSLTAYTDYVGAENEEERQLASRNNYDSIWRHVCELSDKNYPNDVKHAMPIVLMFVPNEGSYILAMNRDPQLGTKAYQRGVLIINPTNLMVVLRLMFLTWQNTRQEKNNKEILHAAARIYEKYATFAEGYATLGNQLNTARLTYEKGLNQLRDGRGNLSRQLQDLLRFGVTPNKTLPENMQSGE
ncbi:MAG: DNA recombination protein RmuC [Bacteroidales bacterium]|nr:DNA recombination protein RmuC [Candidatus Physcousia equi]